MVTKQYENLPYPPFSEKELQEEEHYYKNDHDTLRVFAESHTLEKTNHYLYKGNENLEKGKKLFKSTHDLENVKEFAEWKCQH